MEIKKTTFKEGHAWVSLYIQDRYIGTFHILDMDMVKLIKQRDYKELNFK